MNEFDKQIQAEAKYDIIKNSTELNSGESFKEENYISIDSTKIKTRQEIEKDVFSTEYKMEFQNASEDFWKRTTPESMNTYYAGKIVGSFGSDKLDIKDFFDRINKMMKEVITMELSKAGYNSTSLKNHFNSLESILKIISEEITKMDSDKKIKPEEFASFAHGFINSYVNNMVKEKNDQTKR